MAESKVRLHRYRSASRPALAATYTENRLISRDSPVLEVFLVLTPSQIGKGEIQGKISTEKRCTRLF